MNASSWGPRKHRLAVSEPPSLTLVGRICALWAPAAVPERASTRAPPTLSQRGSRRAPPGRSVLVRDGDPRLRGAEHTRRMARAAQILHSCPSMAAAGRVGWREGRVTDLAEKGRVLPGGGRRARTSRPSASRRLVAERSPNHVSSARAHSTAAGCNSTANRACGM